MHLRDATSDEQRLECVFNMLHIPNERANIMDCLHRNIPVFTQLCQTKFKHRRHELVEYLLNRSSYSECLKIVFEDAFTTMRDKCIEDLKSGTYSRTFSFLFNNQDSKILPIYYLKQITLQDIRQIPDTWFKIRVLTSLFRIEPLDRICELCSVINDDTFTKRLLNRVVQGATVDNAATILNCDIVEKYY